MSVSIGNMRWVWWCFVLTLGLPGFGRAWSAEPVPAEAAVAIADPVVRVSIYGNGLAQIQRRFSVPGAGLYELLSIPQPVQGSLWLDSSAQIDLLSGLRLPGGQPAGGDAVPYLLAALKGKQVVITRRTADNSGLFLSGVLQGSSDGFWQVKTQRGVVFLSAGDVVAIDSADLNAVPEAGDAKPYLRLNVRGIDNKARTDVRMSYLGGGLLWTPAYNVMLLGPAQLRLEAQATIRNELEDLKDVDCELVTGSPNLSRAGQTALVTPGVTIRSFLGEFGEQPALEAPMLLSSAPQPCRRAQIVDSLSAPSPVRAISNQHSDGADISVKNIGRLNLKKNESLCLSLEFANAAYEPVVEWNPAGMPDDPQAGQPADSSGKEEELWNALLFKSPFLFPLAAGPVLITQSGLPAVQGELRYLRPDEMCLLRLSRAQSILAVAAERELTEKRVALSSPQEEGAIAVLGLHRFFYRGELSVKNVRPVAVKVRIRTVVSGENLEAERNPTRRLLGGNGTTPLTELIWELPVDSNTEQRISYQYAVVR